MAVKLTFEAAVRSLVAGSLRTASVVEGIFEWLMTVLTAFSASTKFSSSFQQNKLVLRYHVIWEICIQYVSCVCHNDYTMWCICKFTWLYKYGDIYNKHSFSYYILSVSHISTSGLPPSVPDCYVHDEQLGSIIIQPAVTTLGLILQTRGHFLRRFNVSNLFLTSLKASLKVLKSLKKRFQVMEYQLECEVCMSV